MTKPHETATVPVAAPQVAQDRRDVVERLGAAADVRAKAFSQANYALGDPTDQVDVRARPCSDGYAAPKKVRDALRAELPELRSYDLTCLAESERRTFYVADRTTGHGDCNGNEAMDHRVLVWASAEATAKHRFRRLAEAQNGISGCPCPVVPFVPFTAYAPPPALRAVGSPALFVTTTGTRMFLVTDDSQGDGAVPFLRTTERAEGSTLEFRAPWFVERTGKAFAADARYRHVTSEGLRVLPSGEAELQGRDAEYRALDVLRGLTPEKPQQLEYPSVSSARKLLRL